MRILIVLMVLLGAGVGFGWHAYSRQQFIENVLVGLDELDIEVYQAERALADDPYLRESLGYVKDDAWRIRRQIRDGAPLGDIQASGESLVDSIMKFRRDVAPSLSTCILS